MVMATQPTRTPQRAPQRQRISDAADRFYVNPGSIPDGMNYEWKRYTYGGKEDVRHQANMARNGFTAVPASRHPEIVGEAFAKKFPNKAIIMDGQMLMERPVELRKEADAEDRENAKGQVRNQLATLKLTPEGSMKRTIAKASKKYDIPVPEAEDRGEAD